jgi:hypothetical protein
MISLKLLISEQKPDQLMPFQPDNPYGGIETLTSQDKHLLLDIAAIATAFIPVIGLGVSAGIEVINAGLYAYEGNKYDAGLYAIFAAIPVVGSVASKFSKPAIAYLKNTTQVKQLVQAVKTGAISKLDAVGKEIAAVFSKNATAITQATRKWLLAEAVKALQTYGKQVITKIAPRIANKITPDVLSKITKTVIRVLLKGSVAILKPTATIAVVGAIYHNVAVLYDQIYYRKENIALEELNQLMDEVTTDTVESGGKKMTDEEIYAEYIGKYQ